MDPFVELFDPRYWLQDPRDGTLHPLYIALGVLFAALIAASIAAAVLAPRLAKGHRIKARLIRQMAGWFGAISGAGLFWVAARLIASPLFARPLWLWVTVLALLGVAIYYVVYWRRTYPAVAQAYAQAERRRRWGPQPRRRAAARRR